MGEERFADRIAGVARDLREQPSEFATATRIAEWGVELFHGCDHAGLSSLDRSGGMRTVAASDRLVEGADRRQSAYREGPCLDAIRDQQMVFSPQLLADDRWPRWGPEVNRTFGVNSMLCFHLVSDQHRYGGLNLYSDSVDGFDSFDRAIGPAVAAVAAAALAARREIDQLQIALDSRTRIGQAKGILMERYGVDEDHAFAILRRISQSQNRRLQAIADEVVRTRRLPGL
jgi:transcriptional regulator with GAF, ATPase, and Fis domain